MDPAARAVDLLDQIAVPTSGPCLVVWRFGDPTGGVDVEERVTRMAAAGYLVRYLSVWNPDAVLVCLAMGDGIDSLDETEMAAYGWYRRRHPSEQPADGE